MLSTILCSSYSNMFFHKNGLIIAKHKDSLKHANNRIDCCVQDDLSNCNNHQNQTIGSKVTVYTQCL